MHPYIPYSPPSIGKDEISAVAETMKTGWLSSGPKTVEFEKKMAEFLGCKYTISVNSCTSGLFLSLYLSDIGSGDEVIIPSNTFAATANVVVHCGAKPIFVDINPMTYCIDPQRIEEKINKYTKAIIPVHFSGQTADMEKINKIAKKFNLKVIEDAAHAIGAYYSNNKRIGNSSNPTVFSFYATKNLTTGEGGMITTNDKKLAEKLRMYRSHGFSAGAWKRYTKGGSWKYQILAPGFKFNTTDINSAIGLVQLKKIDKFNQLRRKLAERYSEAFSKLPVICPVFNNPNNAVYHLYVLQLKNFPRDKFIEKMTEAGVGTSVHFIPLHLMPYYQKTWGYKKGDFPETEKYYDRCVSLPLHPRLSLADQNYIIKIIKNNLINK